MNGFLFYCFIVYCFLFYFQIIVTQICGLQDEKKRFDLHVETVDAQSCPDGLVAGESEVLGSSSFTADIPGSRLQRKE